MQVVAIIVGSLYVKEQIKRNFTLGRSVVRKADAPVAPTVTTHPARNQVRDTESLQKKK